MDELPGKVVEDRYGNKIKLCPNCDVPMFLRGAVITCANDCYLGDINWGPENSQAKPSKENQFNPSVTKMCPKCKLEGSLYFKDSDGWVKQTCEKCGGKGTLKEKQYTDESDTVLLEVSEDGRTKCPKCNFKFKVTDPNVWQGNRHKRCGQKLSVPDNWMLYWPPKS